jgi:hypothetical protein
MIRNFLYLDSQKLRSISSQIFEGFSEQVINGTRRVDQTEEQQKGPLASGKVLADIFATEQSSSQLKFLEDHAYVILENELINKELLEEFDHSCDSSSKKSFVKVSGRLQINDLKATHGMLDNFNTFGEALWRVTNTAAAPSVNAKSVPDAEARKKAGEMGMQLNRRYAESAAMVIKFGYGDLLEASIVFENKLFSAPLKREFLRETENLILHKYSRYSQQEFIILGAVTQRGDFSQNDATAPDVGDASGMKEAMRTLALHLRTFEQIFAGPSSNETVIDPIAIYTLV